MSAVQSIETLPRLAVLPEQVSNDGEAFIQTGAPYRVRVAVRGDAPLLFHAWSSESVAAKSAAAKGSTAKRTDDIESYVYRDEDGYVGVPGINFTAAIQQAGRYMQDPRSPRKSALDLVKAGVQPLTTVARFEPETKAWEFEHMTRALIQRSAVTRVRPGMRAGWHLTFDLLVVTPEYIPLPMLAKLITDAGRLVGLCDFRPSYGRFGIASIEILGDD